jgi:hypothetical protein
MLLDWWIFHLLRCPDKLDHSSHDLIQSAPNRLDARLPIAFSAKEAAQLGNQADDFVQTWRLCWLWFFREQISAANFVSREEQGSIQVGAIARHLIRLPLGKARYLQHLAHHRGLRLIQSRTTTV